MRKFIYMISNVYNGRMYIGQTKNVKKRWMQHKNDLKHNNHHSKLLQEDWNIYGEEGFELIVFGDFENYNEMEIKYIKEFDTINNGYNSHEGGEQIPPIIRDEDSIWCTHSNDVIDNIINDLKYTNLTFGEIADKYGYKHPCNIGRINSGKMRRRDEVDYPIRKEDRMSDEVKYLLKNTKLSQKEIAKQLDIARSTVTMINIGANHFDEKEEYPIRNWGKDKPSPHKEIKKALKESELTIIEISKLFNVSKDVVYRINKGKAYKEDNINYPIRK